MKTAQLYSQRIKVKAGDIVFVCGPCGAPIETHVIEQTKQNIVTNFGTFSRRTLKWIADDRFYIERK